MLLCGTKQVVMYIRFKGCFPDLEKIEQQAKISMVRQKLAGKSPDWFRDKVKTKENIAIHDDVKDQFFLFKAAMIKKSSKTHKNEVYFEWNGVVS